MDEIEETSPGSEEVVETPEVSESSENEGGLHPAWNDMLEALPSSLHSTVTPFLVQRDKNYQDGINKVHSQYEPYKPYIENNVTRDKIDYALEIMHAVETRPQDMIKALQDYTGMSKAEATKIVEEEPGQVESEIPEELFTHPKFQELEKMVQTVAQHLVTQKQTAEQEEQDRALEVELSTLRKDKGEFDEEFVLTYAMAHPNLSLDQCVDAYREKINAALEQSRRPPAPKVMGQGGGAPDNQVTQEQMRDPKTRKSVIAQMLQAATQSN